MANQMFDDDRPIQSLVFEQGEGITVGKSGVTKIEAYRECGELGYVPWFAVFRGDVVIRRENGKFVSSVLYFD